ncbi:hypothetical protein AYO44_16835 [Planctomycetaceae bacterium SCGC AG-212-F19]|nr:hypothetical protein AYO44_16835 [Planctomycetaceae bacterium SCGC AG-212-F19]
MARLGLDPDPWQVAILEGNDRRLLLSCCRQAGKSTVVALVSLLEALTLPGSVILLLSRSHRQSKELYRIVASFTNTLRVPWVKRLTQQELELNNGSRIVSLPCQPDNVRGFSGVRMLVIDEAARVPDELYRAVRPMLATTEGRLICLSTPYGKHGFFYHEWSRGGPEWQRVAIPASQVSRISPEHLAEERTSLGESFYRQEYECSFESMHGLVYPDFARCVLPSANPHPSPAPWEPGRTTSDSPPSTGRPVGGIDFGFRNPFAAVWGHLDRDNVLWLTGEHYARQQPLSYHAQRLPKNVRWYADPAGASEIAELRRADFAISKGNNALRAGIAAVTARLNTGTLRIAAGACPNLLHEAGLYQWPHDHDDAENPVDEHNHALAALRYLISTIDKGKLARGEPATPGTPPKQPPRKWLSVYNEQLWTRIW